MDHAATVSRERILVKLPGAISAAGRSRTSRALAGLLSYLAYAGFGALIGVAAGNITVATLVAQLLYIPSIVLGGLMVPVSMFPSGLGRIALLLPATHGMNAIMRLGMPGGSGDPWVSLGVLGAAAVFSFILAALLFEWDSRAARPSRKAIAAVLGIAPLAAAALLGVG